MITQIALSDSETTWNTISERESFFAPFNSWNWHKNWQDIFGHEYKPYYLLIDDNVIAPFVQQGLAITFSGGEEFADYLDIIGPNNVKQNAWKHIIEYLKKNNIESLSLRNVPQDSPTIQFFQNTPGAIIQKEDTTPTKSLPSSWGAYVNSIPIPKHRHELQRKLRKFEREHKSNLIRLSSHPGKDIEILIDLMKKNVEKYTFLTPDMEHFFRKTAETFENNISLLLLTIDDVYAAATLSFIHNKTYSLYNSGFDKERCSNAGFYLKAMSIKHAIENNNTTYNFLQGNERYKYELGGEDFFVYSITLSLA